MPLQCNTLLIHHLIQIYCKPELHLNVKPSWCRNTTSTHKFSFQISQRKSEMASML